MINSIYKELIIDHGTKPRNYKEVENYTHKSEGYNETCGDRVIITLKIEDGNIIDAGFLGSGCAITKASASLMIDALKNKNIKEVEKLFGAFHSMVTTDEVYNAEYLGKLTVFSDIKGFPARVKCATMAWHTLIDALKNER